MKKPSNVDGLVPTLRWMLRQAWSDMKSVYYANTSIWRWLKSGALLFLGFCVWAGASVVLSIRPGWTWLYFLMAYGFLLVVWGPLTHFILIPLILKTRRTAKHPMVQRLARHAGKINLTIFFILVVLLAIWQPGIMLLEFAPGSSDGADVRGTIVCEGPEDAYITCEVENGQGFDHAVVISGGTVIDRADQPPYRMEFHVDEVTGDRYLVQLRNADGENMRTVSRNV